MSIDVRLSTTLRRYVPGYVPEDGLRVEACGQSAADVARALGLPRDEIKFIMVNGRLGDMAASLKAGDRLAFFPAVGGG